MDLARRLRGALATIAPDRLARHRRIAAPYLERIPAPRVRVPGGGLVISGQERWVFSPPTQPWFEGFRSAPDATRVSLGIALLDRLNRQERDAFDSLVLPGMLHGLAKSVPLHEPGDRQLVVELAREVTRHQRGLDAAAYAAAVVERSLGSGTPVAEVEPELRVLLEAVRASGALSGDLGPLRSRLLRLMRQPDERQIFDDGDTWGAAMRAYVRGMPNPRDHDALFLHLASATGVAPSKRWTERVRRMLERDGAESLIREMIETSFSSRLTRGPSMRFITASLFQPANAALVRGAYWAAAAGASRWGWVTDTLGRAGLHWALSGRNDNYARDQRLANTTAALLAEIGTAEALAALGSVQAKVRNRNVTKTVAAALERAAAAAGTSPSELLELAVPLLGLERDGRREMPLRSGTAILQIDAEADASLTWRGPTGRLTESVPAAMARDDKAGVAAAKAELKELRKALAVERGRMEDLLVEDREWSLEQWSDRYLRHPLTRVFAHRLIWLFSSAGDWRSAMPHGDGFTLADGSPFEPAGRARVRLWHPIRASADGIHAWRAAILEREIRQPFKQAFREVYLLAPAEEEAEVYSNRFAGHVLNYPVARALMGARRWGANFLGPFDGGAEGIAKREFRSRRVRAEFYHDAIEDEDEDERFAAGAGAVEFCRTDQVRFYPLPEGGGGPVPLRDVPATVFSETMRDVDLFVSVSSVAADVNWRDAGRDRMGRFEDYWQAAGFGELGPTATSRREVLAWLIPQLAIRDRLTLDDKHLRVRGDRRTYKIHLGSGNILMEPDDQYLCIVPARDQGAKARVFLPFDDDHRLSVILSKAQLLANDRAIKDPTITRQIATR